MSNIPIDRAMIKTFNRMIKSLAHSFFLCNAMIIMPKRMGENTFKLPVSLKNKDLNNVGKVLESNMQSDTK
jgi:hypothetical protein